MRTCYGLIQSGAGPVGIEMALVLIKSGHYVTLVEQGQAFAANMQTWKHVSLFSPNKLNMSSTGREVLREMGVSLPNGSSSHKHILTVVMLW